MRVPAIEAESPFGSLRSLAESETVVGDAAGQHDTMIVSASKCLALQAKHDDARRVESKRAFELAFGDWMAAENVRVDVHGIPGAELRPW